MFYIIKCEGCGREFEAGGFMDTSGYPGHIQNCTLYKLHKELLLKNAKRPKPSKRERRNQNKHG